MNSVALKVNTESKDQVMTLSLDPNGNHRTFRVQIKYLDYVSKYIISVWDAMTGEPLAMTIPLVASYNDAANDLFKQFSYKGIGSLYVAPVVKEPTTPDPTFGTLGEFEIVWGDSPWLN